MAERVKRRAPKSSDDLWLDHVRAECANAAGAWLESSVRLERPIRSLTSFELQCLAEAVTSRWIVLASERIAAHPNEPGSPKISTLLLAG